MFRAFAKVLLSYGAGFLLSVLSIGILVEILDISSGTLAGATAAANITVKEAV